MKMTKREYMKNMIKYNWRRWTGQFRSFPEVKGMSYRQYKKAYLR